MTAETPHGVAGEKPVSALLALMCFFANNSGMFVFMAKFAIGLIASLIVLYGISSTVDLIYG